MKNGSAKRRDTHDPAASRPNDDLSAIAGRAAHDLGQLYPLLRLVVRIAVERWTVLPRSSKSVQAEEGHLLTPRLTDALRQIEHVEVPQKTHVRLRGRVAPPRISLEQAAQ